jgi:membrane-bound lytic murein transglycosylase D
MTRFVSLISKNLLFSSVALLLASTDAYAVVRNAELSRKKQIDQDMQTDPFVRRQIRFWEAVFQKYKSNSVVIHDVDDPIAMIDVIDFDRYITSSGAITSVEDSDQTNLVRKYIDRYNIAVERFAKLKDEALKFGPIEQRLYEVYNREPQTLARLYSGNVKFRGQGGLADTFLAAANRAQEFMPYMESTFKKYGLPVALTRLPFVESMFNLNAKSKVGASGIWQFMPDTAREYMHVGPMVDERNNPYKATHAAAQLFLANYGELGSWPLAVTAYNHGRGGMSRATRQMGTAQLGNIINNYKSPSFGFASKNFYAELLAAGKTYELLTRTGLVKAQKQDQQVDILTLQQPMSVKDIARITKLSEEQIAKYNPCLTSAAVKNRVTQTLPRNYEMRLPRHAVKLMRKTVASNPSPKTQPTLNRR